MRFIGGETHNIENYEQILSILKGSFGQSKRLNSTCKKFLGIAEINPTVTGPHELANVDLFITTSTLGVAENGSVWR